MKFLIFSANSDAERGLSAFLKKAGVTAIASSSVEEAYKALLLHGSSVDLALIVREGDSGEPGIQFIQKIKEDASQADLPIILVTSKWSDQECAAHQESSLGANGYLKWPSTDEQIKGLIDGVLGVSLDSGPSAPATPKKPPPPPAASTVAPPPPPQATESISIAPSLNSSLEDPSLMFSADSSAASGGKEDLTGGIKLEVPDLTSPSSLVAPSEKSPDPSSEPSIAISLDAPEVKEETAQVELVSEPGMQLERREGPSASDAAQEAPSIQLTTPSSVNSESGEEFSKVQSIVLNDALKGGTSTAAVSTSQTSPEQPASVLFNPQAEPSTTPVDSVPATTPPAQEPEPDVAKEMPYLFSKQLSQAYKGIDPLLALAQATGDAIVPGGAAQSPDMETLKKYLLLREQDVAALSAQLRSAREQVGALEEQMRVERAKSAELEHMVHQQLARIERFEEEKSQALELLHAEAGELRFQVRAKTDKVILLETQVKNATEELEQIKKRVKMDIRKIRVREKELENRLEIMKKDSEALIGAREAKIIELKRKLDLLEFNMDLLQDQHSKEKEINQELRERLVKVAQAMKIAGGLIGVDSASLLVTESAAPSSSSQPAEPKAPESGSKAVS